MSSLEKCLVRLSDHFLIGSILISDKIDFKTKAVKRDKEGHYIMTKGSIQEEEITIINIYALVYCIGVFLSGLLHSV